MKILITGADGMLGRAMKTVWFDHQVAAVDKDEFDITIPGGIADGLNRYRPNVVINCAAYTAVDAAETDYRNADMVNGTAVGYLARACDAQKIPIVHISTDYVFHGTVPSGYAEDAVPDPINAYGRTKLHGEEQVRLNAKRWYIVRTSWLYGPGGKNFVTTILDRGRSQPEVKVVNDQHGKLTFTRDVAGFVKTLLLQRAPYGIYHGVNEGATTWYDVAVETLRLAGIETPIKPISSREYPTPATRPAWSVLLNTKRPPLRPWRQALKDFIDHDITRA